MGMSRHPQLPLSFLCYKRSETKGLVKANPDPNSFEKKFMKFPLARTKVLPAVKGDDHWSEVTTLTRT